MTRRLLFTGDVLLGRAECTWNGPDGLCETAAVVHACLTITPEPAAAALCTKHWASTLQAGYTPIDFHAFGEHCNLPDARWINSTHSARGTCRLPNDLTDELERHANQPEGASL